MQTMGAAAADVEADGLPVSGEQSTTTTTTQANKSAAEAVGYVAGYVAVVIFVLLTLVLLIVGVAGAAYLFISVAHLLSRWGREWSSWSWSRTYDPVEYTVTIAAFSGLEAPTKDQASASATLLLRRLDPAFNLTLGVASPITAARRECVQAGTTVEVSYLRSRVPLASGPAPAFCVDVGERREEGSIVAWGDGVRLPRFVLDSLAADVRRGGAEFGIKLTPPIPPYCDSRPTMVDLDVISCWAKAGGGPAPCRVSRETVSFPPLPRPGWERDYSEANLQERTQERRDTS